MGLLLIRVRSILRWLGGFDEAVLKRCETEGMRATATGILLIVVGGMATCAASLTAHQFMHVAPAPALLLGACWGFAIMSLDRWVLLVIKRQPTALGTLALAVPRVLLAVVAGLVIAKPLVLDAFPGEIARQAAWDRKETVLNHMDAVDRKDDPRINALTSTENHLQAELGAVNTSSALNSDPLYRADEQRAQQLETKAQAAFAAANCELDGTCGTRHVGAGPVYVRKLAYAQSLQAQANAAEDTAQATASVVSKQQQSATTQDHSYERNELAGVLSRLGALERARTNDEHAVRAEYGGPIGLADRLEALSVIDGRDPSVGFFSLLLTLTLMLIDSAPALGKALILVGPKTAYETELDAEENAAHEAAKLDREIHHQAEHITAQEIVDQANIHRQQWDHALIDLVAKIVAIQRDVTEEAIQEWERRTRARLEADASEEPPSAAMPAEQIISLDESRGRGMARRWPAAISMLQRIVHPRRRLRRV